MRSACIPIVFYAMVISITIAGRRISQFRMSTGRKSFQGCYDSGHSKTSELSRKQH